MKTNKFLASALLGFFVLAPLGQGVASAQTSIAQPIRAQTCLNFTYSFGSGSNDNATNGSVTQLQTYLTAQRYFNSVYLGTGWYGRITAASVAQFQRAHGINATGYVGPLTRAALYRESCGGSPTPVSGPVSISTITPGTSVVGNTVTLYGTGFTQSNTVLMDGLVAARGVALGTPIAIDCFVGTNCQGGIKQTISFVVPTSIAPNCPPGSMCPLYLRDITPGSYQVSVQNENGTSNSLTLVINTSTQTQPLTISGLDTPSTLSLGQSGTWTVHVLANSGTGTLHYSVVWGDEANVGNSIMAPQPTTIQTSATFSHAYQRSGLYTPRFTVTDDSGNSVTTQTTIQVTPLYYY